MGERIRDVCYLHGINALELYPYSNHNINMEIKLENLERTSYQTKSQNNNINAQHLLRTLQEL